jgi:hypothetical protein
VNRRIGIMAAALTAALAAGVAAFAIAAWEPTDRSGSRPRLELTSKRLRIAQTAANHALIRLRNAKPGERAEGTTTVWVRGTQAEVSVRVANPQDRPGRNGGKLIASGRLWIDIRCGHPPCGWQPYRGPMSQMGTYSLGTWRAGQHRTYRIRVWFRRTGRPRSNKAGDNAFQGSRATFGLVWSATAP